MKAAFIVDAVRTPRARRKGKFSSVHPVDLLTYPLNSLVQRNSLPPSVVEDVLVGCVTQTGEQGWCVGRAGVLAAGWPYSVPATTINRLCGSGQQTVNFAAAGIQGGNYNVVVASGLEHMTRAPMFSDLSGEESPLLHKHHPDLVQQGFSAEILAEEFKISRTDADALALKSQINAKKAADEGRFKRSLVPVPFIAEDGVQHTLDRDDNPRPETTLETLAGLKLAFKPDGILTAGNSSAIVDGAAAVLLASEEGMKKHGLKPRARIVAHAAIGSPPRIMLTGPIEASKQVLNRAGLKVRDIDVWEINEAFAPVVIMTARELGVDESLINVNGGAIALGHPLGATGNMLIGTALDELERRQGKYALVTMCIGLGMGIATIIERI